MFRFFIQSLHRLLRIFAVGAFATLCGTVAQAQNVEGRVSVGLYKSPPFVMTAEDGSLTGMAVDLWERLDDVLKLETEYIFYDSLKDLTDAAASGDIDVAVTNLTITQERAERVNFTQPWFDAGLRIMVADQQGSGISALVRGLSSAGHLRVYGWMLLFVLTATVVLTLFDRRFDPDFPKRWRDGLAEGFYTVMSVATSGKPPSRSKLFGWVGRMWAAVWLVCGIGVLAFVTSSVTSVMTTLAITGTINSPADLPGKTVAVFTGSVSEEFARTFGLTSRSYFGIDEAVVALVAGRVDAIVADAPVLEYYEHIRPENDLSVVGPIFEPDKYGFAMPLDSTLRKSLTVALLGLKEEGVIDDLRTIYFGGNW
jgi:ABC-type amino acid transport substrate-binding protein